MSVNFLSGALGLFALAALLHLMASNVQATPTPSIAPASIVQSNLKEGDGERLSQAPMKPLDSANKPTIAPLGRINNAEKLKRGLTNFMNQLNPASFFVPAAVPQVTAAQTGSEGAVAGLQSAAEPAALVNGDPSVDVVIKGSTRLAHSRPIGGPLRWGRKR